MSWKVVVANAVVVLTWVGCAGSGVPSEVNQSAPAAQRADLRDTETGSEVSEPAPDVERVHTADLAREPDGAVGFTLGSDSNEAESTCTSAGYTWKKMDGHIYHCDGLPEASGMEGTVFVQMCDGEVCLLRVALNPTETGEAGWMALYDSVLRGLDERYGEAWQQERRLPERCEGDALEDCLEKGEAALDATWQWPGGQKVELRMVPPTRARSIAVRLTYSTAGSP